MTPDSANPITPEALLENASWMRSLARGLLGDPHEAEDVVQEASVAALVHAPAESASPEAWLGRVVRNAAWRRLRARKRREARELLAARPESQPPSPSESLERLELQELLLEAVRELDEPFRTTVVQRHFEGLSSAEIARAAGVPEGTVRWRLKRGLELLRARLDRRVGRESWAALLTPLALRDAALPTATVGAGTAGTTSLILQGAIAMGTWKLLATAATVLTLGLAFWNHERGNDEPSTPLQKVAAAAPLEPGEEVLTADEPRARTPEIERAPVAPVADTEPVAQSAPVPAAVEGTLVARFVDEDGSAWPGVHLRLVNPARRYDRSAPEGPATTGTSDGRVRLEVELPPDVQDTKGPSPWQHDFLVSAAGAATTAIAAYVSSGETTDVGDVVLRPGARVRGRVTDEHGLPLEGARVGPTQAELPSDPSILARQGGRWFDRDLAVRSGPDGAFVLDGVEVGERRVWAKFKRRHYGWSDVVLVEEGSEANGVVVELPELLATDRVAGRVFDPQGEPARKVALEIVERSEEGVGSRHGRTDEDGRFDLVLSLEGATLDVTAKDRIQSTQASAQGVPAGTLDLELRLRAPDELAVTLRDPEGEPVTGASFHVGTQFRIRPAEATELSAGAYRVAHPATEFRLEVEAPGFRTHHEGPLHPGTLPATLVLTMQPIAQVVGLVSADGEPVDGAKVEVREHVPGAEMTFNSLRCVQSVSPASAGETDSQGRFALDLDLDLDRSFWVRATLPGWSPGEAGPFEVADFDAGEPVEIELTAGRAIEGYLLVANGASAKGRIVAVNHGDGDATTQRLGEDGFYRFEGLTPGAWQVLEVPEEIGANANGPGLRPGAAPLRWSCTVEVGRTTRFDLDRTGN